MAAQPTWRTGIGIAKEAVAGTGVAPTASIPVEEFDAQRVITQLEDKAWRASAVEDFGQVQGRWHSEIGVPGDLYGDTFGWFLSSILGDVTFTAASPNTHAFSVLNTGTMQPGSKTLTDFYGASQKQYAYAMCVELGIKWNADGKVSYTSKWVSKAETTPAAPTLSYTAVPLQPGWATQTTIRAANPTCLDGEVNLKRPYDVIPTNNSQDPQAIFVGPLTVDGKCTLMMEDETYYTQYTGNNQGILDFLFSQGAGASLTSLQLHMTLAAWTEGKIDRGGNYLKFPLSFKALGNSTDAGASGGSSPIKASLRNAIATAIYQ